jgi:hypothetical protein
MPNKRTPRPTAAVVRGLDDIYSFMGAEHEARQAHIMECRCEACRLDQGDCRCDGRPYAAKCKGCRCHEDIGTALGWIAGVIDRHRSTGTS